MDDQNVMVRKILVADDNRYVNDIIKEMLEESGYTVSQVFDGQEALSQFSAISPDLMLLDYRMPEMDGIDVLKKVKKIDPNALVIFITGEGSEGVAVKAMKAGADDYLIKPLSFPDMLQTVNKLIKEHDIMLENLRLKARGDAYKDYLVTLSETMGDALITADAEGLIQFMNYKAREFWGPEEDNKGRPVSSLFEDDGLEAIDEIGCTLGDGVECFEQEHSFQRIDGTTFWGRLTVSRLRSDVHSGGMILVVRDLTDIEEMRRQMINAEKLASLGKVVEGVAHEVRNSLTSLGGFSRRMRNSEGLNDQQRMYVAFILEDVKRLETTIKDIEEYVNYTKIHRPQVDQTDIRKVVEDALNLKFAEGKCAQLECNVRVEGEVDTIPADHDYLVEAFGHLFENACEAMDGKGRLDVEISANSKYLIVDVIDTGHGIPEEDIKDIFNPFYTSKVRGAGVGLSKVYMIVEEHDGYITVKSEPGQGTRMRVYLARKQRGYHAAEQDH